MVNEGEFEERLRRLYHQITTVGAEGFAHEIAELISVHLPKPDYPNITIYGTRVHDDDFYPNDYSTLLLGALSSQGYSTTSYPLNLNGQGNSITFIPSDLVTDRPNILVDIHISRVFGIYLMQLKARGASKALYACPIPTPGSLWEYQEEGNRVLQLRKLSV